MVSQSAGNLTKESKDDLYRSFDILKTSKPVEAAQVNVPHPTPQKPKQDMVYKQTIELLRKTAGEATTFNFDQTCEYMIKLNYFSDMKKDDNYIENKKKCIKL